MFIVTLLVLTVFLSYSLAGAAGDTSVVQMPHYQVGRDAHKTYARDLILSNRFWIYLILGVGFTLLLSTTVAIAFIMHVKFTAILASMVAVGFFITRSVLIKNAARRRRQLIKVLQIAGTGSAMCALVILLRS
ncbi:MAG: hypothetical protein GIW97_03270 [Candidatus Eremiobacteraeota bacterium]|nr:hypothetical protein [Candidatus Eremiobacteraeota bacterium]